MRLTFSKVGPTRFIGHLDLARALERALRRAAVPVSYTQGFNRRPRMQFAAALPLGFTSECELADVWLEQEMAPQQMQQQLMERMAPGIIVHRVEVVPLNLPALQTVTKSASYEVYLREGTDAEALATRVAAFLEAPAVMRERRGKTYDLRPLVEALRLEQEPEGNGRWRLVITVVLRPDETGRPDEVLEALELDPLTVQIHRKALQLADEVTA
jgi:radical SAM-linked protein